MTFTLRLQVRSIQAKGKAIKHFAIEKLFVSFLLLLSGLLIAGRLYADVLTYDQYDVPECRSVKDLQPPEADVPSLKQQEDLANCDAKSRYYITLNHSNTTQSDWNKVRECAFATDNADVLLMLYINGLGVKFNPDLAIKYLCSDDAEIAEPMFMLEDIERIKETGAPPSERVDVCKYAENTRTIDLCTGIEKIKADNTNKRELDEIASRMNAEQKASFDRLQQAVNNFVEALGNDVYLDHQGGTNRSILATSSEIAEKKQFLEDIKQFETGNFPSYTNEEFVELDKKLNSVYRDYMRTTQDAHNPSSIDSAITKNDVRKSQRLWLKYRDAWVDFGSKRYPTVQAYVWKALFTDRRIDQFSDSDKTP